MNPVIEEAGARADDAVIQASCLAFPAPRGLGIAELR
jgi:hypothetical protein